MCAVLARCGRCIDTCPELYLSAINATVLSVFLALQGFTKEITLDRDRWVGYIKDYDGGTLMECVIQPKLPYTTMPVSSGDLQT